ncbi:MAG: hypothetical protein KJO26_07125 [Deltaproteobacteria bacterium]|nr:hypothetical protein [Deltaproteobacteria bacterium]
MKITNDEVIKTGEQELIDSINGELDWEVMEDIFMNQHQLEIGEDVEYRSGDLIVHDNQVAYQLEFEVKVKLSILVDRGGNYLAFKNDSAHEENPKVAKV